jgi:hypothetical protein
MFKFKCILLVSVTLVVTGSLVGCGTKKNSYHRCSPYVIMNKDTTEIYILESQMSAQIKSVWINNPIKNPNNIKVKVVDSTSFNGICNQN